MDVGEFIGAYEILNYNSFMIANLQGNKIGIVLNKRPQVVD